MSLKIVVLAKQVPDTRNVGKDAMTAEGTVNRAALPAIFNPEDLNALEQALRLKEQNPGSTVGILQDCRFQVQLQSPESLEAALLLSYPLACFLSVFSYSSKAASFIIPSCLLACTLSHLPARYHHLDKQKMLFVVSSDSHCKLVFYSHLSKMHIRLLPF